jgi:hypothetical protein
MISLGLFCTFCSRYNALCDDAGRQRHQQVVLHDLIQDKFLQHGIRLDYCIEMSREKKNITHPNMTDLLALH